MKKITLLFTILCAGQLYGMEAQNISDLPKDVHNEIIKMALATSDNLDEAIKAIKVASALRGIKYDNLKKFTALVGVLAQKFPDLSREEIAQNFNTPLAKQYSELNYKLENALRAQVAYVLKFVKETLDEGADPNYTWKGKYPNETWLRISYGKKDTDYHSILGEAYNKRALAQEPIEKKARTEVIELLLAKGANPNVRYYHDQTLLQAAQQLHEWYNTEDSLFLLNLLKKYAVK